MTKMNWQTIALDALDGRDRMGNLQKWQDLLQQFSLSADTFEIHCWEDEPGPIALALEYGKRKDTGWARGVVIAGTVTPGFLQMLLSQPLPGEEQQLTPFFSVFLDNGFSSEHYGTEINIREEGKSL